MSSWSHLKKSLDGADRHTTLLILESIKYHFEADAADRARTEKADVIAAIASKKTELGVDWTPDMAGEVGGILRVLDKPTDIALVPSAPVAPSPPFATDTHVSTNPYAALDKDPATSGGGGGGGGVGAGSTDPNSTANNTGVGYIGDNAPGLVTPVPIQPFTPALRHPQQPRAVQPAGNNNNRGRPLPGPIGRCLPPYDPPTYTTGQWIGWGIFFAITVGAQLTGLILFNNMVLSHEGERKTEYKFFCSNSGDMDAYICVIAVGQFAKGLITLCQVGFGLIQIGQAGIGLVFCVGQGSLTLGFGVGQICIGTFVRAGQLCLGSYRTAAAQIGFTGLGVLFGYKAVASCGQDNRRP